ncbi:MAG: biotin transporter BioY [Cyanobacteria bacterium P01_C01_bin.89]
MTRRLPPRRRATLSQSILLWAAIGLVLTICGTFVDAYIPTAPWTWFDSGAFQPQVQSLGTRLQIAAVLLTGCLGGAGAGAIAQIAYVGLGLAGLPIFNGGGGLQYITVPSFGYLLGFIMGGIVCGRLVTARFLPGLGERSPRGHESIERLTVSAGAGLVGIHATGLLWLLVFHGDRASEEAQRLTWTPLGGQLILVCAVALISWIVRRILF